MNHYFTAQQVLDTGIHLAQHKTINQSQLVKVAGPDLVIYLIDLPEMPNMEPMGSGPSGITVPSWLVAEAMRNDPELVRLYELARADRKPSGRGKLIDKRG